MTTGWWLGYISYDFVRRSRFLIFKNGLCLNHYSGPNNMKMNWDLTPGRIECWQVCRPTTNKHSEGVAKLALENKWCETQNNNFPGFHPFLKLHACVSWLWPYRDTWEKPQKSKLREMSAMRNILCNVLRTCASAVWIASVRHKYPQWASHNSYKYDYGVETDPPRRGHAVFWES